MLNFLGIVLHETLLLLHWLIWPAVTAVLMVIILRSPSSLRTQTAVELFGTDRSKNSLIATASTIVFFLALFGILLAKNTAYLKSQFEIRWHIAFLNYDLAWHTPAFSLAGNALYQFGIKQAFP